MDNFVYMYTHAVVWRNYIGASRKTVNGHGRLQIAGFVTWLFIVVINVLTRSNIMRREPDGRYVDYMRTL